MRRDWDQIVSELKDWYSFGEDLRKAREQAGIAVYPATTTNALGQTTEYQYDYSTGKPTQTVDPNGLKFQITYDGLGRPLQAFQPDQVKHYSKSGAALCSWKKLD